MKKYFFLLGVCIVLGSCSSEDMTDVSNMSGGSSQEGSYQGGDSQEGEGGSQELKVPKLVINELCVEKPNNSNKTEFIELKMLSDGNLSGMRVVIMGNSTPSKLTTYDFLSKEVRKTDFVVLHLRTLEESSRNEYGNDKAESGGENASSKAWDFWIPDNKLLVHEAASVVYVLDQDDNVLDAVMISNNSTTSWGQDYFTQAAEFLFNQGAWKSTDGQICRPADSVISIDATPTQTICRDEETEDTNTAADWYITVNKGATPGEPNNPNRFGK